MVWNYSFGVMGRLRITPLFLHLNHRYDELNASACLFALLFSCHAVASKTSKLTWMRNKFHLTPFIFALQLSSRKLQHRKKNMEKICNALHFSWNCLIYQFSTQLAFPARKMVKKRGRRRARHGSHEYASCNLPLPHTFS